MEQWSILNNVVNYVQYDRHPRNFYDLDVKTTDQNAIRKYMLNSRKRIDRY